MSFTRIKENFVCEHCGREVVGNGYTNHCPACLWSKHVDVHPGDRAETCGGMMEPFGVATKADAQILMHRCTLCGFSRRQTANTRDNFAAILSVSQKV